MFRLKELVTLFYPSKITTVLYKHIIQYLILVKYTNLEFRIDNPSVFGAD